jgi:hypothetical protein
MFVRDPLFALFIDSASNNETVEVEMVLEQLIPGVQSGHHISAGAMCVALLIFQVQR